VIVGVVLAGGESRRFGSNKLLATYRGLRLLERVILTLSSISGEVVVSMRGTTASEARRIAESLGATVVYDDEALPCQGPPRGVVSAFKAVDASEYVILGGDQARASTLLLEALVGEARMAAASSATIVQWDGFLAPTIGYATREAARFLIHSCMLKRGMARLTDLYRGPSTSLLVGWHRLTDSPLEVASVNYREDLDDDIARSKAPPRPAPIDYWLRRVNYLRDALERLEEGRVEDARRLLLLEAKLYRTLGLVLLEVHALKDYRGLEAAR